MVGNRRNDGDARTDTSVGGNVATNPPATVGASQGAVATPRTIGGKNGPGSGASSPKTSATPRVSPGCSCQIVVSSPSRTCAARTGSSIDHRSEEGVARRFGDDGRERAVAERRWSADRRSRAVARAGRRSWARRSGFGCPSAASPRSVGSSRAAPGGRRIVSGICAPISVDVTSPAVLELDVDVPSQTAAVERRDLGRREGEGGDLDVRGGDDRPEVVERLPGQRRAALARRRPAGSRPPRRPR